MISSALTRRATQVMSVARRNMSGASHAETLAERNRWFKLTGVMVTLSTLFGVYNFIAHEHEHGRTGLPYQRIRTKPYPWSCNDCTLFDGECWKECKENK